MSQIIPCSRLCTNRKAWQWSQAHSCWPRPRLRFFHKRTLLSGPWLLQSEMRKVHGALATTNVLSKCTEQQQKVHHHNAKPNLHGDTRVVKVRRDVVLFRRRTGMVTRVRKSLHRTIFQQNWHVLDKMGQLFTFLSRPISPKLAPCGGGCAKNPDKEQLAESTRK